MSIKEYEELESDKYYSKDEIANIFGSPSKINLNQSLVLKSSELFDKYKKEELLDIYVNGKNFKVSKILLHDLLEDEGMYKYLLKNINNHFGIVVRIIYIIDEATFYTIEMSRSELAASLNEIREELTVKGTMRLSFINSLVSPFSLIQEYAAINHICLIADKEIEVPASHLIDLFLHGEEEILNREELGYIICDFIKRNHILEKYKFDSFVLDRYQKINISDLDNSSTYNDIMKNIELPNFIIETKEELMRRGYSPLEIAIYLSLKVKNYLVDKNDQNENNFDIEFTYLFAKILDELEIAYTQNSNESSIIKLKSGEFIVLFNSLNDEAFKTLNSLNTSKEKFEELLEKMSKAFVEDEKRKLNFKLKVQEYETNYQNSELTSEEKIKMFLMAISRKDLKGIDNINYIKKIFKKIFGEDKNVSIDFLGKVLSVNEFNITPIVIVTILDGHRSHYYKIDSKSGNIIESITKEKLEEMLLNGYHYYHEPNKYNLNLESEKEYARAC